jgi:hypothetical protein
MAGAVALALFALAANVLVWQQQLFTAWVLGPLGLGLAAGAVWLALVFRSAAGSALRGRAAGGVNAVASSVVFLGICMVAYAFVETWDVSWDLTREGRRQLSPQTIQVLQSMTKEAQVICFFIDVDDELVLIARDKTLRFLDQCRKYTGLLKVEVLDPHIERARLEALNITHASTQGTVVIKAGTRQRVITLSGGSPRLEERDFTNALINVLRGSEPKVGYLMGHDERDLADEGEQGMSMLKNLLEGEAYQVVPVQIKISLPEVPEDCDLLVINNPRGDLHPQELKALETYLDAGGRLLILLEPWKNVRAGTSGVEHLRPWLESRYGIIVGSDLALNDQQKNKWEAELRADNAAFEGVDQGFMDYRGSFNANHPITKRGGDTMLLQAFRTVRAAEKPPEGVMATELLRTAPGFWAETDVAKLAETGAAKQDPGEQIGPLILAVAAVARGKGVSSGGKPPRDARLVVVGDADFVSNDRLSMAGHLNFVLNAVAWLTEHEELIAIRPTGKEDQPIVLSDRQRRSVAWISTLLTLQLVAAAGLVVFAVRRKNQ